MGTEGFCRSLRRLYPGVARSCRRPVPEAASVPLKRSGLEGNLPECSSAGVRGGGAERRQVPWKGAERKSEAENARWSERRESVSAERSGTGTGCRSERKRGGRSDNKRACAGAASGGNQPEERGVVAGAQQLPEAASVPLKRRRQRTSGTGGASETDPEPAKGQ